VDEDGDLCGMKSTVSILNDEMDGLGINGFSQLGFLLNNGLRVIGPCAVFPRSVLQWNVGWLDRVGLSKSASAVTDGFEWNMKMLSADLLSACDYCLF